MSYFFNGDFEDYLASNRNDYLYQGKKHNTEFEYFILWLENEALLTHKSYEVGYLEFIKKIKEKKVNIVTSDTESKPWCQSVENKKKQKFLNSKLTSTRFAIENDLCHPLTEIIEGQSELKEDYIYKEEFGLSGMGSFLYPKDEKKIAQSLNNHNTLIAEPLLKRVFDLACCVTDVKDYFYQSHIDDYFQYKGSTFGLNLKKLSWFETYYENILKIKEYYQGQGIKPPYSIDSFLYKENGEEKLYTLSEVNARKTMGFTGIKLWNSFYPNKRYCALKLFSQKNLNFKPTHDEIYQRFNRQLIPLSPYGNTFFVYLVAADNLHDLYELEDELLATLFDGI